MPKFAPNIPVETSDTGVRHPLFSVLIANYNNGKYLMDAIESVRQQTYTNWEIILVDDGSTDNSKELYKDLQEDERIHIYYNGENKGCGFTKHRCVLHANGVFCGFLDPDDALLPNALEISTSLLSSSTNYSLFFSRNYICDANLQVVKTSRPISLKEGESYFEHHDYRAEHFASFRRIFYLKMGGIDVTLKAGVDADLYFRLEEIGKVIISHEVTYKYRISPSSITSNWMSAFYWNLIVRHNTCVRRGLPFEEFSLRDYLNFLSYSHWQTRAYRLGKFFLSPLDWLKYHKWIRKRDN